MANIFKTIWKSLPSIETSIPQYTFFASLVAGLLIGLLIRQPTLLIIITGLVAYALAPKHISIQRLHVVIGSGFLGFFIGIGLLLSITGWPLLVVVFVLGLVFGSRQRT